MSEEINQVECPVGMNPYSGMDTVVKRFNMLQKRFGALEIIDLANNGIFFRVSAREYFMGLDGAVSEVARAHQQKNQFSQWIESVAAGGVRDESGTVRIPPAA